MTGRAALHQLIEWIPESELQTAERFLEYLRDRDPLLRALWHAPIDDEPETEEERDAVREAEEAIARGEVYSWEEVRAELEGMDRQAEDKRLKRKKAS